jgi:hypothetical protein
MLPDFQPDYFNRKFKRIKPYNLDLEMACHINSIVPSEYGVRSQGLRNYIYEKYEYELDYEEIEVFLEDVCELLRRNGIIPSLTTYGW